MALIQQLARDKSRAVLAVTHDHRTLPYADRIVTIEDGLIVSDKRQRPYAKPLQNARPPANTTANSMKA